MIAFGILLHAFGGFAAGSFYIPFKKVRGWAWESYWLAGGVFSWILVPSAVAWIFCPDFISILQSAPVRSLLLCALFGMLWGVGGLTFGLSMRYLGMSLGYALALGFCAAFGTIIPPIAAGTFSGWISSIPGLISAAGVTICLAGVALSGAAGMRKEKELPEDQKKRSVTEFNLLKGVWVALFSGIMSACMAFALAAGKPIASAAVAHGTPDLFKNFPVLVVVLAGGFMTNCVWCLALGFRNRSFRDFTDRRNPSLAGNYIFSALAGITWYFQFFFYGMATTRMGRYDFSSWTIHMAFIIAASNLWGLYFHEWEGTSRCTRIMIVAGILILATSAIVVGIGNWQSSAIR